MPKAKKYTTRKYDGGDAYTWAIFRSADVKGTRDFICYGQARPVSTGMNQSEARHQCDKMNRAAEEAKPAIK